MISAPIVIVINNSSNYKAFLPTTDGMLFGIPFDKGQVLSESLTKPSVLGSVRFPNYWSPL